MSTKEQELASVPDAASTGLKQWRQEPKQQGAGPGALSRLVTGAKRLSKRVGQAEATLILRIFYVVVFGGVALVMRGKRRQLLTLEDSGPVAWLPRRAPGTDPTKQY